MEDEIEKRLLGELTASDHSSYSDDDDSIGTADLAVVEVTDSECSDSESDDVQCATACSECAYSLECYNYVGGHDELCRAKRTVC